MALPKIQTHNCRPYHVTTTRALFAQCPTHCPLVHTGVSAHAVPSCSTPFFLPHQTSASTLIPRSQLNCHLLQEAPLDAQVRSGPSSSRFPQHPVSHHSCAPILGLLSSRMEAFSPPGEHGKTPACTGRLLHRWPHLALHPHHSCGHVPRGENRPEGDTAGRGGKQTGPPGVTFICSGGQLEPWGWK